MIFKHSRQKSSSYPQYKKDNLTQNLDNLVNYAVQCNSEDIYRNVYQTMTNYKTAYIAIYADEYANIVEKRIDTLKFLARRDGVKL